jgi:hypothetical protein
MKSISCLFVDEIGHAGLKRAAPLVILRDQPRDCRFDEGVLFRVKEQVCRTIGAGLADGRAGGREGGGSSVPSAKASLGALETGSNVTPTALLTFIIFRREISTMRTLVLVFKIQQLLQLRGTSGGGQTRVGGGEQTPCRPVELSPTASDYRN